MKAYLLTCTDIVTSSERAAASNSMTRRNALKAALASAGAAVLAFEPVRAADAQKPDPRRASPKRYDMLKSINLWAFPFPDRMNLRECLQMAKDAGFDGDVNAVLMLA